MLWGKGGSKMNKRTMLIVIMVISVGLCGLGINSELKNEAQVKKTSDQNVMYINDPSGW